MASLNIRSISSEFIRQTAFRVILPAEPYLCVEQMGPAHVCKEGSGGSMAVYSGTHTFTCRCGGVQSFNRSVTREELTETVNRINAGIQGNR